VIELLQLVKPFILSTPLLTVLNEENDKRLERVANSRQRVGTFVAFYRIIFV